MTEQNEITTDPNYADESWFNDDITDAEVDAAADPRASEDHPEHGKYLTDQSWQDYENDQRKRLEAQMAEERKAHAVGAAEIKRTQKQEQERAQLVSAGLSGDQTPGAASAGVDDIYSRLESGAITRAEADAELTRIGAFAPTQVTGVFARS